MTNLNADYREVCKQLIEILHKNKEQLTLILMTVETYQMSEDEISCCIKLLKDISKQEPYLLHKYDQIMCCFLPLNQPLYSLLLQVIIPSFVMKEVYYRPPVILWKLHDDIYSFLCKGVLTNIHICKTERSRFLKEHVYRSNIVNFTGKYENALRLIKKLPKNVSMIYNGSAINPIVITQGCNLSQAVVDTIAARLYNSGQDCMAPGVILVEKPICAQFIAELKAKITLLKVGNNHLPETDIGNLLEYQSIECYQNFLHEHGENLILPSSIIPEHRIMSPAIFYFDSITTEIQDTYYAPYFIIMSFMSKDDIQKYLDTDFSELYAGYISVYCPDDASEYLNYTWRAKSVPLQVLINQTLLSAEDGNEEFGGYGKGCSFLFHNNSLKAKPILLLRELQELYHQS